MQTATEAAKSPSTNGSIFKMGRVGRKTYQIDENIPGVSVDVVAAASEWSAIVDFLYDESPKPEKDGVRFLSNAQMPEYHRLAVEFITKHLGNPNDASVQFTAAEAAMFIADLQAEAKKLTDFFHEAPKPGGDSSSRASALLSSLDEE